MAEGEPRVEERAVLLRKIHWKHVVPDNAGGWRVASGYFHGKKSADGLRAFSVFVNARLADAGIADVDLVASDLDSSLVSFAVELPRTMDLEVYYRPEGAPPLRDAHAEVEGKITGSLCTKFSMTVTNWLVLRPRMTEQP